jgi:hypothetical protein
VERPTDEKTYVKMIDQLKTSDLPEVEKVTRAFEWVTGRIIEHTHHEIELAKAIQDQESLVKHYIKLETIKHARSILQQCHQVTLGRRAWDE